MSHIVTIAYAYMSKGERNTYARELLADRQKINTFVSRIIEKHSNKYSTKQISDYLFKVGYNISPCRIKQHQLKLQNSEKTPS